MQTKVKRSTVIAVSVLLCGAVLALWVWNVQMWKGQRMLSEACSAARVFVYDHLEECGQAFANYAATGDGSYLDQAQQAAAKTVAACYAWGETYPYRADYDTADEAIQEWGIQFLVKTEEYLEGLDKTDLSAEEQTVLDALAGVFQADDAGRITFMSLFWNASHSSLVDGSVWPYLTYDEGVLQRPDF